MLIKMIDIKDKKEFEKIIRETQLNEIFKSHLIECLDDIDKFMSDKILYLGALKGKITGFWFMEKIDDEQRDKLNNLIHKFIEDIENENR